MTNAEELFTQALRLSPDERAAWLRAACGDDDGLRDRVRELLAAQEQIDSQFLEAPADELQATILGPFSEVGGSEIGPYKLREQLGEGGMGVVFVADQKEPVKRRVALKIIKPGMDSAQVIARFEAERQALAMMDHPGIARVLDAGTTATGRPYFAMELVKGVPITQYCDDRQLATRERLQLFIPVCHAVQHAHQKGVVHRDIKPSNILVAEYDDRPVPMIIDFGIAKALNSELTEKTVYTQYGQLIGTLEYMSPEQAKLNQLDVDTRSDVYSLGVVLYELLTGTTPLTKEQLRSVGYDEMLRMIRETEAPRPSTRLTQSAELPAISANRNSAPQKLGALMKGELDWIVMKALEKDRTRRYSSASELGDDIQRHLDNEPVEACPPSAAYRLSKFVRRNRAAAATVGVLLAGTLIAAIGAGIGYFRLQHALVVERDSRAEVEESLAKVEVARGEAVASEQAALKSERAATESLERLKVSQEAERQANLENALLHANKATSSIESLRQQKPLALQTAINALQSLPDKHPARDRLRNQIEWGLLCTPKLVHQMEIPPDARFGYSSQRAFRSLPKAMYLFRGEDLRSPLTQLFTGRRRIGYDFNLRCFTEIQLLDPYTGRLTPVTLKGRFRRIFPVRDSNVLVTVDLRDRPSEPEVVRFWDLSTGKEAREPVQLKLVANRVVGAINNGEILLTRVQRFAQPAVLRAIDTEARVLGEAPLKAIRDAQAKPIRTDKFDNLFITDLGNNQFQIQYMDRNHRFLGLGKLTADALEIIEYNEATPSASAADARLMAFAFEEDADDPETLGVGGVHFLSPETQEKIRRDLPLIHGSGETSLVLSEDSRVLMVGRRTGSTAELTGGSEVWNVDEGHLMCRLDMKAGDGQRLSRNGQFVALIETEPTETHVTIHRTENGSPLGIPITLPGKYEAVTFSADSRRLFTVYETPDDEKRHVFQIWEIPGLTTTRPMPTSGVFRAMAFNSAGELCACQHRGYPHPQQENGSIHVWDVDQRQRTRIIRCQDAGRFGQNTFGSKPDTALSIRIHSDLQSRIHLWNTVETEARQQTIVPSTRVVPPVTLRLTPQFVFWKTVTGKAIAYDLESGQEVAMPDWPEWATVEDATLCNDNGTVHFRVGSGNLERMEFDGKTFRVTDRKTYSGPGVKSGGGPRQMTLAPQHIVISTDSGLRRISRSDLAVGSPFLLLGDGPSDILAVDQPRNRIAVYNRAGHLAVIDVASGRPLLQRTIPPAIAWNIACFNPTNGDLLFRARNDGGMIYHFAVPDLPELSVDELSEQVESHTGLSVKPGRVLESAAAITELDNDDSNSDHDGIDIDLSRAIADFGRRRNRSAWIQANRYLQQHPNDWLALLIRGHAARMLGEVESLADDVTQAVAIARNRGELRQIRPWLQALAYVPWIRVTGSAEDRIAITFEYVDVLKELPDSQPALTILLETCHSIATRQSAAKTAAAIESKAEELELKDFRS